MLISEPVPGDQPMSKSMNEDSHQEEATLIDVTAWPEWSAYLTAPGSETLKVLDLRARCEHLDDLLFAAMMKEYAATQIWRIAQHLGFLYGQRDCLVESYYFSYKALKQSGDVRARISFAVAAEKYGHLEHALTELALARRQVRSLKDRNTKRACMKTLAVCHVRTCLGLARVDEASRWNQYLKTVDKRLADHFAVSIVEARCGVPSNEMVIVEERHLGSVDLLGFMNHIERPSVRRYFLDLLKEKVRQG